MYSYLSIQVETSHYHWSIKYVVLVFYTFCLRCTVSIKRMEQICPYTWGNEHQPFCILSFITFKEWSGFKAILGSHVISMFLFKLCICFIWNSLFFHCFMAVMSGDIKCGNSLELITVHFNPSCYDVQLWYFQLIMINLYRVWWDIFRELSIPIFLFLLLPVTSFVLIQCLCDIFICFLSIYCMQFLLCAVVYVIYTLYIHCMDAYLNGYKMNVKVCILFLSCP